MDLEFWNRLEPKAHWERNASCGSATLLSCASCGYDRLPGSYPAAQRLERHRLNINMSSMSHRCHRWVWKWCNMATPQFWQFHLGMGFGVAFFQTHQWITDNHSMSRMAYVTSSPYTACYNEELAALDLHGVIPTDGSLRRCQNRDDRDDADDAPDPFRPLCRPLCPCHPCRPVEAAAQRSRSSWGSCWWLPATLALTTASRTSVSLHCGMFQTPNHETISISLPLHTSTYIY